MRTTTKTNEVEPGSRVAPGDRQSVQRIVLEVSAADGKPWAAAKPTAAQKLLDE
jgi:hypothetical protein